MQGFRARSQLLAETLEENDNVLQKEFLRSDDDGDDNKQNFVRRGTFSIKKNKNNNKNSELDGKKRIIKIFHRSYFLVYFFQKR